MKNATALTGFFLALILCSCDESPKEPAISEEARKIEKQEINALFELSEERYKNAIESLENKVRSLTQLLMSQQAELRDIKKKLYDQISNDAYVEIGDSYAPLRNKYGTFPIIYKKAEPVLNGYRLFIDVGNTQSVTFVGAKLTIRYMKKAPTQTEVDAGNIFHVFEQDVTNSFYPGATNTISVVITPVSAEQVAKIIVGLEFSQIVMNTSR